MSDEPEHYAAPIAPSPDDGAEFTALVAETKAWAWRFVAFVVLWLFVILLLGYVFFLLDQREAPRRRARVFGGAPARGAPSEVPNDSFTSRRTP